MYKKIFKYDEFINEDDQKETSDDIISLKIEDEEVENPEEYEIDSIISVSMDDKDFKYDDESEFKDLEGSVEENVGGTVGVHADLSVRQVKRGDTLYVTALLRRGNNMNSPAVQGVLKVRVVDIHYGLRYLNKVINK